MGFPPCSGVLVDRYQAKGTYLLSGGSCYSAGYRAEKNSLCAYNKLGGIGCICEAVNKVGIIRKRKGSIPYRCSLRAVGGTRTPTPCGNRS